MNKYLLAIVFFIQCFATSSLAQKTPVTDSVAARKPLPPVYKFYVGTSFDGALFSVADLKLNNVSTITPLRFSWFLNTGLTFNYNLSRHIGIFTGIDLKNIGFIEHVSYANASIVKRRTYNIGIPAGIKIGNMAMKKTYIFLGGGADAPINYKEKQYVISNEKTKFSEWFSQRTPAIMPYVFAGIAVKYGVVLKAQYYPNNFLNPAFTSKGAQPYAGYNVHLMMLTIGYAIPTGRYQTHDLVKSRLDGLQAVSAQKK